jgi:hypothetical protein
VGRQTFYVESTFSLTSFFSELSGLSFLTEKTPFNNFWKEKKYCLNIIKLYFKTKFQKKTLVLYFDDKH